MSSLFEEMFQRAWADEAKQIRLPMPWRRCYSVYTECARLEICTGSVAAWTITHASGPFSKVVHYAHCRNRVGGYSAVVPCVLRLT